MKNRANYRPRLLVRHAGGSTRSRRLISALPLAAVIGAVSFSAPVQAQTAVQPPQTQSQQNQPDLSSGAVKLPDTPPPTGQQAPVPKAALPLRKPSDPRQVSPGANDLAGKVDVRSLTINDAVALALSTNRDVELAGEAVLRAQGRTAEARAAFNPTLGATYTFTHLGDGQSATFSGQTIPLVAQDQNQVGISASLTLDFMGVLRAAKDQAQYQEIATRLDVNRTRNQVVLAVKTAFYDVLRQQALVNVATERYQNSLDRLNDTQIKLRAGTLTPFEVLRAQADVADAQQQLITSRNNVSLSIANLNNAIGIDINTPIRISSEGAVENPPGVAPPSNAPLPALPPGSANPPENVGGNAVPEQAPAPPQTQASQVPAVVFDPLELGPDYNKVLQESLDLRPEIRQADTSIAAAKKGILLAKRSVLPTFGVSWGFSYTPDAVGFSPQTTTWEAVAQVSIPLYDGGLSRARITQAKADIATAETNRRQAVDQVTLEVRQAYLNLVQARNRVAVANQALAQAREAYRLARVRYVAGVTSTPGNSPLLEISDAQSALTQAESNQISALYDFNNARTQLDKAIGRYAFVNQGPGFLKPPSPKTTGSAGGGRK